VDGPLVPSPVFGAPLVVDSCISALVVYTCCCFSRGLGSSRDASRGAGVCVSVGVKMWTSRMSAPVFGAPFVVGSCVSSLMEYFCCWLSRGLGSSRCAGVCGAAGVRV
jgi:hypothetical protein